MTQTARVNEEWPVRSLPPRLQQAGAVREEEDVLSLGGDEFAQARDLNHCRARCRVLRVQLS